MRPSLCAIAALLAACGGATGASDLAAPPDLGDKAASCASTFGDALTAGFGRVDGTIHAVVPPGHPTCPMPNADHLVVQVDFGGATYRMVVNVQSDHPDADPAVRLSTLDAPLVGGPFAEGWHVPSGLDYVQSLDVHAPAFQPHAIDDIVAQITAELSIGEPISIFSTNSGGTDPGSGSSTHLIHRNAPAEDGALITRPNSATPHWLLFAFSTQTF